MAGIIFLPIMLYGIFDRGLPSKQSQMWGSGGAAPDAEKIVIFHDQHSKYACRFLQTFNLAHITIPLHQSKVATILHITTACLADDDNCASMNSMMHSE